MPSETEKNNGQRTIQLQRAPETSASTSGCGSTQATGSDDDENEEDIENVQRVKGEEPNIKIFISIYINQLYLLVTFFHNFM